MVVVLGPAGPAGSESGAEGTEIQSGSGFNSNYFDQSDPGRADLVDVLESRFGIRVHRPDRWADEDLESLARGAASMPAATWETLDQPLVVEYVDRPCLFAVGRYNDSCPTFADEARTHFFVYEPAPLLGEGAVERLEVLTRAEQRDIQLRRAVVHLAMVHLDDQFGWSNDRHWRAVNGWPDGSGQPLNRDPWGYSRYLGMESAHLDLVTFAEQFFVRPEDLLLEEADDDESARRRLEQMDPDRRLVCQQFTKRRLFNRQLEQLDSEWSEPRRPLPHLEEGRPECPAFEQWARPDQLEGFEILLAATSADDPESLFGHLLLHVRYREDEQLGSRGFEPVYQFGAVTDEDIDPFEYLTRGFLGGFPSILEMNTFRGIDRLFLQYQQRDLRRYRLRLDDRESRQLLERIWEAERRVRYPYLFMTDNCASFLLELIGPALDVEIPERPRTVVMPTDVLDILADIEIPEGGPLLEKKPATFRSNRQLAEESLLQRRALVRRIAGQLDEHPEQRAELQELNEAFEDPDPVVRREGYRRADVFFESVLEVHPDLARSVVDLLYHSVRIERYFTEMSHFVRQSIYARTRRDAGPESVDEILDRRREIFRTEDMSARLEAFRELTTGLEAPLAEGPGRELTDRERRVVEHDDRIQKTYLVALEVQSSIIDRHIPDWSGVEYLDEHSEEYRRERRRVDDLSTGASGRHRLAVGGRWLAPGPAGAVDLSYSLVRDRLGEIRRRGYRGDVGTRILGLDATVPVGADAHRNLRFDLVALRYESLRRTYGPLREGLLDRFGWSVDARAVHDGRRDLVAGAELTPGLLLPVWTGPEHVDHLVVRAGAGLRYDVAAVQEPIVGGVAGLFGQLHLYGNYTNVARFGVETGQYVGIPSLDWRYDATARIESRHRLTSVGQRPLSVGPFVRGLWTTRDYRDEVDEPGFRSWEAGVEIELPF